MDREVVKDERVICAEMILPLDHAALTEAAELEAASFPDPWSESDFAQLLSLPSVRGWGAWIGTGDESRKLISYCLVQCAADEGEILRITTAPACRQRGTAERLLEEIFRRTFPDTIYWFLEVRESNLPARALYAKLGFQPAGVRKNYYRDPTENALILRRES